MNRTALHFPEDVEESKSRKRKEREILSQIKFVR
jgi:hypothetical protein